MSNIFERETSLRPGDVVLLFAGPTPARYALGTWLQSVAQDAHRAAENVPIFVVGLDRATTGANSVARALEEMGKAVGDQFPDPKLIELGTEEAEACLAACPFSGSQRDCSDSRCRTAALCGYGGDRPENRDGGRVCNSDFWER